MCCWFRMMLLNINCFIMALYYKFVKLIIQIQFQCSWSIRTRTNAYWVNAAYFMLDAAAAFVKIFYNYIHNFTSKLLFAVYPTQQSSYDNPAAYIVPILGLPCLATHCCFINATTKTPINQVYIDRTVAKISIKKTFMQNWVIWVTISLILDCNEKFAKR